MEEETTRDLGGAPTPGAGGGNKENSASTPVGRGRNYISVIGIDRYQHLQILHNAVSDAGGVRSLFIDQLGFEEATEPLFNEHATLDAMVKLVRDELSSKLEPDDNLVLFFAGHGYTQTQMAGTRKVQTGYLIPVEGASPEERRFSTYLKLESFLEDVAKLPARHVMVILDSCYSGFALGDSAHSLRSPGDYTRELSRRMSRRVITSAMADQPALDSGPVRGHSLFTGTLIEALALGKADLEHKGFITSSELGLHVQKNVADWSKAKQTPDFGAFELDDRGELVISLTGEEVTKTGMFKAITRSPEGGRIALQIEPAQFILRPGTTLRVAVNITNLGDQYMPVQVTMAGLPEDWATLSMSMIQLDPGRQKKITLTLSPPRLPQARAGEKTFTIRAENPDDTSQAVEAQGRLTLASYVQFDTQLEPARLVTGQEGEVTVVNQGNQLEVFTIEFTNPTDCLSFEPQKTEIHVPEGEKLSVNFNASPKKRHLFGAEREYPFSVQISHPKATPKLHPGELLSKPLLSTRLIILLAVIVFVGVTGTILAQFIPDRSVSPFSATQTALYSDPDEDGLTNFDEARLKTDSQDADSDDDGLNDFEDPQPLIPVVFPVESTSTNTPAVTDTATPPPSATFTPEEEIVATTEAPPTATDTPSPSATFTPDLPATPFGGGAGMLGYEFQANAYTVTLDEPVTAEKHALNRALTSWTSQANYSEFRISPDGQKIAYWVRGGPGIGSLYLLDSNGKSRLLGQAINGSIAWDASSRNIAYVCRGTHGTDQFAAANPAICVVPTTGGIFYYVLNSDEFNETHTITTLAWSPDSRQIAFASDYNGENLNIFTIGVGGLSRIPLGTARPSQITFEEDDAAFPAYSPDGEWIAYAMQEDAKDFEIFLITSIGTNRSSSFTSNSVDDCWPAWSPDGIWLAYTTLSCGIDSAVDPTGKILLYHVHDGYTEEVTLGGKPVWLLSEP